MAFGRRAFITLAGGALIAQPGSGLAQQPPRVRRIAIVHSGIPADKLTEAAGPLFLRRLFEELRRLGHREGANLVVERYSAEGSSDRFAPLAAIVVSSKPDVIVTNFTALTKALMMATATIPIVAITNDPIEGGLVSSLARPGANLTGVSVNAGFGIVGKRLQILKEAIPSAARIGFLVASRADEQRYGVALITKFLSEINEAQVRRAFAEMAEQRIEAALVSESFSFVAQRAVIVELAAKHSLPVMYPYREYMEPGGLMSYGPDTGELGKRMASDVHEIFNGAKPGDIPYYLPVKFELVLNLTTAKALGLAIPLLRRYQLNVLGS